MEVRAQYIPRRAQPIPASDYGTGVHFSSQTHRGECDPPMSQMFEYAVICQEKRDRDGDIVEPAEVVVPVTQVLASDEKQAQLLAARSIPEAYTDGKLDRVQVVIRPF